jgi:hypothetical protein
MKFQTEKISVSLLEEAKPLLEKHWREIAYFKDIELNPDYYKYLKLQELDSIKAFICRDDEGLMIGYATFIIQPMLHYKQILSAIEDILYIHPEQRRIGGFFIKYCDEQLDKLGVQLVSHHIKLAHDWSRGLERMGYVKTEFNMVKRLHQ